MLSWNNLEDKYKFIPAVKRTYTIVSQVAYLIGVKKDSFQNGRLQSDIYERLDGNVAARRIRALCRIRNTLMRFLDEIENAFLYNMKNLDTLPSYFSRDDLRFLQNIGISLVKPNAKPIAYLFTINQHITNYIHECSELFPLWLDWAFIKEMFIMGDATKESMVRRKAEAYYNNVNWFPYQCYINWQFNDDYGNLLHFDAKFITLLYAAHGKVFNDYHMVIDAGYDTQNFFHHFIMENEDVVFFVDCENSDPYRLCATFRNINKHHEDYASHVRKIILYDDVNAATTWSIFDRYIEGINVDHRMIKRLQNGKSLVDSNMIAGACDEFYKNGVRAFVIVSSDSDFYALTTTLPDARFLVMLEHGKQSTHLMEALGNAGIRYCFIDNFSQGTINDVKIDALLAQLNEYLLDTVHLNVPVMLEEVYKRARIQLSPAEEKTFMEKYIKRLRLSVDANGDVSIMLPEKVF